MTKRGEFTVLVASDGLLNGRAALAAAAHFPWPSGARLVCAVARPTGSLSLDPAAALDLEQALSRVAEAGRRVLARRTPAAVATVVDGPPADGLLRYARRARARALVVSPRGRTTVDRFLMGSVSRAVLRSAECPVLVVRGRVRPIRHVLIGLDGSANAGRAVDFVAGLEVPLDGRVSLVRVIDPVRAFSFGPLPAAARSAVSSTAAALESKARFAARQDLDAAAQVLGGGWTVAREVRLGVPLTELLAAARARGADVVVVGARGVGGVKRLLLGSVAEGLVDRSPVPVLVVR